MLKGFIGKLKNKLVKYYQKNNSLNIIHLLFNTNYYIEFVRFIPELILKFNKKLFIPFKLLLILSKHMFS